MNPNWTPKLFTAALGALLCATTISTPAATVTVTSTADTGAGTLRNALGVAHNGDTINFSLTTPAKITLTSGELRVSNSVSILGPGPGNLRVDGNALSRVFYIRPSNTVTLSSLTITNGAGGAAGGGGIFNDHSTLAVSNCSFLGNTATHGAGIFNDGRTTNSATLTVINSSINRNSAGGYGGGIFSVGDSGGGATLTVSNCSFIGNSAANSGGAIDNKNWTAGFAILTLVASTVSSNSAGQFGGGIHNNGEYEGNVTMTLIGCNISSNSAHVGGAINNDSRDSGNATGLVIGCTLNNNAAFDLYATGGGICNNAELSGRSILTLSNCTLSGNWAALAGGGIYNDGYGGSSTAILHLVSCTLSSNAALSTAGICNDGGNNGHAALTLIGSTLHGNMAGGAPFSAGGIFNDARSGTATLALTNSTLSDNSAIGMFSAGGILNDGAPGNAALTVIASTLSGNWNTNSFSGGGIYNYVGSIQIGGTIIIGGPAGTNLVNNSGTITSLGYNLSSDNGSGRLTNTTDQINSNPMLGPLQDNGGPTFTHALLANSPAIDKGKSFGAATDQRGWLRPYDFASLVNAGGGDGSDIGAVEAGVVIPFSGLQRLPGGAFQFSFTGASGASFTILNSTNISVPFANWTALGAPTEISSGRFQFTDPQATNHPRGYYGVRSP